GAIQVIANGVERQLRGAGGGLDIGGGKFVSQGGDEGCVVFAEADGANAALGGRNKHATQRRVRNRVADARATSSGKIAAGRHAQFGTDALIQAAGRTVPGGEESIGD